jgi:hypothetical protein
MLREKLAAEPDLHFRAMLAVAVIGQNRLPEGRDLADACAKDDRLGKSWGMEIGGGSEARQDIMTEIELAYAYGRLGDQSGAIAMLRRTFNDPHHFAFQTAATLRAEPRWDPLRSNPGFQALLTVSAEAQKPL